VTDLSVSRLKDIISTLPNCDTLQYCGNVGDVIASKNIQQHIQLAAECHVPNIQFHTNGGMRSSQWWAELPKYFTNKNFSVTFAIDGLEDTNHLYRRRVRWEILFANIKSFINNGGKAKWQFLLFEHNKHQLLECYKLSKQLGFEDFICIKNPHTNGNTNISPTIDISDKKLVMHEMIEINENIKFEEKHCFHLRLPSLFVNYQGIITPCCHLSTTNIDNVDITKNFSKQSHLPACIKNCSPSCNLP
jgi:sulfatase maturation enzyme AslB (radical SAM superfamily)